MLTLKNITYEIDKKAVLKNLSLAFNDGEIVVITGANGSGKTTLLKIIMGILPAKTGKIFLDNQDITELSIDKRAKMGLSMAFQQPTKFKGLTIERLLQIAKGEETNISNACEELSKVGLCARNYLKREFNDSLSGGERKRIEIALSLARNCQNCLFDEPEAGIDMWSFDNLVGIFNNLKKENKCVVIVSHNEKILKMADKILLLDGEKINFFENSENALQHFLPKTCIKLQGGAK